MPEKVVVSPFRELDFAGNLWFDQTQFFSSSRVNPCVQELERRTMGNSENGLSIRAVSPAPRRRLTRRRSKGRQLGRDALPTGSRRYSRFGNLRYEGERTRPERRD